MLSLKKAAMKQTKMRSLSIATNHISSGVNRTTRFALRTPSEFLDVPRTCAPPGFFDESVSLELISVSQPSQVDGYDHQLRLSPARSSSDGMTSSLDPRVFVPPANQTCRCRVSWDRRIAGWVSVAP